MGKFFDLLARIGESQAKYEIEKVHKMYPSLFTLTTGDSVTASSQTIRSNNRTKNVDSPELMAP